MQIRCDNSLSSIKKVEARDIYEADKCGTIYVKWESVKKSTRDAYVEKACRINVLRAIKHAQLSTLR